MGKWYVGFPELARRDESAGPWTNIRSELPSPFDGDSGAPFFIPTWTPREAWALADDFVLIAFTESGGSRSVILKYNGSTWSIWWDSDVYFPSAFGKPVVGAIWGWAEDEIVIATYDSEGKAADSNEIIGWDGASFTKLADASTFGISSSQFEPEKIRGASRDDFWVHNSFGVSDPHFFHWNGVAWSSDNGPSPPSYDFTADDLDMEVPDADHVWTFDRSGSSDEGTLKTYFRLLEFDVAGSTWSVQHSTPIPSPYNASDQWFLDYMKVLSRTDPDIIVYGRAFPTPNQEPQAFRWTGGAYMVDMNPPLGASNFARYTDFWYEADQGVGFFVGDTGIVHQWQGGTTWVDETYNVDDNIAGTFVIFAPTSDTPPYLQNQNPAPSSSGNSAETPIYLEIVDSDGDLDVSTVDIYFNGTLAWTNDGPEAGFSGWRESVVNGYAYTFNVWAYHLEGTQTVRVTADDLATNSLDESYTFDTIAPEVGSCGRRQYGQFQYGVTQWGEVLDCSGPQVIPVSPLSGGTGFDVLSPIVLRFEDNVEVVLNTMRVYVKLGAADWELVYEGGGAPDFKPGWAGPASALTGTSVSRTLTIERESPLPLLTTIQIWAFAEDPDGNGARL